MVQWSISDTINNQARMLKWYSLDVVHRNTLKQAYKWVCPQMMDILNDLIHDPNSYV